MNLTGNFLEAKLFADLSATNRYLVTAEWPYTQPTFNGTADIIAINYSANLPNEPLVAFAIECKKVRPDQKVWVFDKTKSKHDILHPFLKMSDTGKRLYNQRLGYLLPSIGEHNVDLAPVFNKGYELRQSDGSLNRNESEKIYGALLQANKAFVGLVKSNLTKVFKVQSKVFEERDVLIVPIVVTNAQIKTINYDPMHIDSVSLELLEAAEIINRDFIIYDFPLVDDLQLSGSLEGFTDIQPYKRPTFIVNASKALEIMDAISRHAEM